MASKYSFVLLELLIGFALVSMAILPFIRFPYTHLKQEINALFTEELERFAQNRLVQFEIKLRTNKVPEEDLFPDKLNIKKTYPEKRKTLYLPDNMKRTYIEKRSLVCKKQKANANIHSSLLHLKIEYFESKKNTDPKVSAKTKVVIQKTGKP